MNAPHQPLFSRLAAGGSAVAVAQGLRLVLRLGSMVILARLLTPREFGLFGMAALVYGLLQTGRDLGLSAAAVQSGELLPPERTLLFWLQSGAGLVVGALTCVVAPGATAYFRQPELTAILCTMSVAFFLSGLGGQFRVELSRALRFREISALEIGGLASGIGAAILLARLGAGYWALVGLVLTQEIVVLLSLILIAPWRPGGWPGFAGAASFLRSGLHLSGYSLVQYATQMIDQAWAASVFGSRALGLYGRAWQLGTLPTHGLIAGLSNWMTQGLVKLRDQPDSFRTWCGDVLNALAYLCTLLAAVLFIAPEQVLRLLLGSQWVEAGPALRWLALTLPLQPWLFAEPWILTACRGERRLLGWSLVRLAVLIAALGLSRPAGLATIAGTVALVHWLLLPASFWVIISSSPIHLKDILQAHLLPLVLGALAGAALQLTRPWWIAHDNNVAMACIGIVLAVAVAGSALVFPRLRRELDAAWRLLLGRTARTQASG